MDKGALGQQIGNDPRIAAYINQRKRGSMPVELDAATLAQFGYQVPQDWKYRSGDARNPGHLYDTHDGWDTGLNLAAGALMAYGVPLALAGPTAAAPTAAEQATNAGGTSAGLPEPGDWTNGTNTVFGSGIDGTTAPIAMAGNAGSAISRYLGNNWQNIAGLGLAGVGAANQMRTPPAQANLERVLGLAEDRVNKSAPLFDALNRMALAQLPDYTKG